VCRENGQYPPLDESRGENLISPVVMCGPQGLQFREPVELRLPHSASANSPDQWCFSLKAGTGAGWKQVNLDDPDTQQNLAEKFVTVKIQHF
jgi:tight junction protein 1